MSGARSLSSKAASGLQQLIKWYASPVGLIYGLLLALSLVLAFVDAGLAVLVLVLAAATVVPWKLIRQRNELRAHVASSTAVLERVDSQIVMTPTFDQVEKTLKGFKRSNRKVVREVREGLVDLQIQQSKQGQRLAASDDMDAKIAKLSSRIESLERALPATERA